MQWRDRRKLDKEVLLYYAGLMLFGVLISTISQVMLKKASLKFYGSGLREYMNPLVLSAYIMFLGATFMSIYAYKVVPLSWGPVVESLGYIFVTIFGYVFFGEKISWRKRLALGLILLGTAVFSFGG